MILDDITLPEYENPYIRFQMDRYGNVLKEHSWPFEETEGDGTNCIENRNQLAE